MTIRCYTQKIFNVSPTKSLLNEKEKENAFFGLKGQNFNNLR